MRRSTPRAQSVRARGIAALALLLVALAGTTGGQESNPLRLILNPLFRKLGDVVKDCTWDWSAQGAWLKSDAESNTLFERGKQLIEEKRYPEASLVLQRVLDSAGVSLASTDGHVYHSLRSEVEKLLAALSPDGLKAYRLRADAEAAALLGDLRTERNPEALKEVTERFFISSLGDDAALLLAGIRMDDYRFAQAARLLRKIADGYPDPSVDPAEVHARLAVASARLGDATAAAVSLHRLDAMAEKGALGALPKGALALVRAEVASGAVNRERNFKAWHTAGSVERGDLRRPALPKSLVERDKSIWITKWQGAFRFTAPTFEHNPQARGRSRSRRELVKSWTTHGWTPSADVAVAGGRLLVRAHASLLCCDAENGTLLWEQLDTGRTAADKSAFVHADRGPSQPAESSHGMANDRLPRSAEERTYFADRVGRMVSVIDGRAFCIQHNMDAAWNPNFRRGANADQPGTTLAAFDVETGKPLWSLGRGGTVGSKEILRFLSTPITYAGRLLVPAEDTKGELLLLALDPEDGAELGRTFLCGYGVAIHQPPASPVGMIIDGGELFIASGTGLLFALDAASCRVLWASRYRQQIQGAPYQMNRMNAYVQLWEENVVVPYGGHLYVLPSDSDVIARFDRQTGMPSGTWRRGEGTTFVGVDGDGMIVCSSTGLLRYNLKSGLLAWKAQPGAITGRPMLAGDVLCVPTRAGIVLVDPETGKQTAQYGVENGNDPVGNLYTDGQRVYVAAVERVYALQDLAALLARLNKSIDAAPAGDALVERAHVFDIMGRAGEALADLRRAHALDANAARLPLLKALLARVEQQPDAADALLAEAEPLAVSEAEKVTFQLAKAERLAVADRLPEAVGLYTEAALSSSGALVTLGDEEHALSVAASEHAAAVLRQLRKDKPGAVPALLEKRGRAALRAAVPAPDPAAPRTMAREVSEEKAKELLGIGRAFPGTDVAASALRMAADIFRERGDFERAEAVLATAEHDENPRTSAAGLAALAALHQGQGWPRTARDEWQRLAKTFGDGAVPWDGGDVVASALAAKRLPEIGEGRAPSAVPTLPLPPYKLLWSRPHEGVVAFGLDTDDEFLRDHMILLSDGKPVCLRVTDGREVWRMDATPTEWRRVPRFNYRQLGIMRIPENWQAEAGHVYATFAGEMQVLGLVSGRVLFREGADQMGRADWERQNRARTGNVYPIYCNGDVIAVCRDESGIVVRDTATANILWRRNFTSEEVLGTMVVPSCVAVVLGGTADGTTVWCCDRRTGRLLGKFPLYRSVTAMRQFPVVWAEDRALFVDMDALKCRELPSGKLLWEVKVGDAINMMGDLSPGIVGIGASDYRSSRAAAYEIATGKKIWQADIPTPNHDMLQGVIADADGSRFYTIWNRRFNNYWMPVVGVRSMKDGSKQRTIGFARSIDAEARKIVERTVDQVNFGNYLLAAQESVAAGDHFLAFRMEDEMHDVVMDQGGRTVTRKMRLWEPVLIGKRDGIPLRGFRMPIPEPSGMLQYPQFAGVKGEVLIILSNRNIMAFAHDAAAAAGEEAP